MLKRTLLLCIIVCLLTPHSVAQFSNCPKIRVGVQIKEIYPEVLDFLRQQTGSEKHSAVMLSELGEMLMDCLRENSPDLEFIYLSGAPGADYDYLFSALIALSGGGERVIVVPEYTIADGDNIFIVPPVYGSEYTVYKVYSSLIVNSNCYPSRRYILVIEIGGSDDIRRAILTSLSGFGRGIEFLLYKRESERPVPPRVPQVETKLEKEYISPLDEETRRINIYETVTSCNGVPAYWKSDHSQPVRFPVKTDRGEIEPTENCKCYNSDSEVQYILVNEAGYAAGEYTLKRGLDPLLEKITLSTCPLGNKPNIEKEVEIIIRGLELKVEPDRKEIYNGEETSVKIDLHEIDPDGVKYPVAGREVELKITGLEDGTVTPSDKVTTDGNGFARLEYKAGKEDRQIKIEATFTPPGYPEKATGEAVIDVQDPNNWEGIISKSESMEAGENQSLLAALTPGGEYDISKNWTVKVTFKPEGSNAGYLNYSIIKAVMLDFSDEMDQTMFHMEREGRVIDGKSQESAKASGRALSTAECDLRLTINPVNGKYWIAGEINVEGIEIKGRDEMEIKVKPVDKEIDEAAEGTTGINEEIDISGSFTPNPAGKIPSDLNGTKDFLEEVPEEFREFLEALGGKQKMIMKWNLKRKVR